MQKLNDSQLFSIMMRHLIQKKRKKEREMIGQERKENDRTLASALYFFFESVKYSLIDTCIKSTKAECT